MNCSMVFVSSDGDSFRLYSFNMFYIYQSVIELIFHICTASPFWAIQVLRNVIFLEIGPPPTPS